MTNSCHLFDKILSFYLFLTVFYAIFFVSTLCNNLTNPSVYAVFRELEFWWVGYILDWRTCFADRKRFYFGGGVTISVWIFKSFRIFATVLIIVWTCKPLFLYWFSVSYRFTIVICPIFVRIIINWQIFVNLYIQSSKVCLHPVDDVNKALIIYGSNILRLWIELTRILPIHSNVIDKILSECWK